MVRALIKELEQQADDEGLDTSCLGPLAVKLTDAILRADLLLVGGKAWEVEEAQEQPGVPGFFGSEVLLVTTKPGSATNRCSWCRRTYRSSDVSSPYRLCPSCWNEGPAEEDLA